MKILVVGVGIIGSIYGWALSEGGHEVTHWVRPGRAGRSADGMPIDVLERRRGKKDVIGTYAVRVTESVAPSDGYDMVIVPTKPYQVLPVLRALVPLTGDAAYLLLTQNWDGTAEIDALLPRSRYIYGDAHAGGVFRDGVLVATIMRDIVLGQVGGGSGPVLSEFTALFEGIGLSVLLPEDILHYIWVQYAINAGLWTGLVRVGDLRKLLRDGRTGRLALLAVRECLQVVARRGVDLAKYPEARLYLRADSRFGALIAGSVVRAMFALDKSVQRASAHGLGDPREIKDAFDALLRTGAELNVPMPVTMSFRVDLEAFAAAGAHSDADGGVRAGR